MPNKFLVIQTASIGDVVLATPIIEKLHQFFPDAQIDVFVRKGYEGLFTNHPFVHAILLWDKSQHKYLNLWNLARNIRKNKYDYTINLQRFLSTGMLTVFSGSKQRIGFDKNPMSFLFDQKVAHQIGDEAPDLHEIDRNLRLIASLTDHTRVKPRLYPAQRDFNKVSTYKSTPYICIAPASLWFTKQYPEEKWIEFVRLIPKQYKIYLLGSASDKQLCDRIVSQSGSRLVENLSGQLSLLESAALMQDAHMNYVNDSAPMHLASAVNAAVTVIFCSTVTSFGFGPLSDQAHVIETTEKLACRPCGIHGFRQCPEGHFRCATTIENQKLIDRL